MHRLVKIISIPVGIFLLIILSGLVYFTGGCNLGHELEARRGARLLGSLDLEELGSPEISHRVNGDCLTATGGYAYSIYRVNDIGTDIKAQIDEELINRGYNIDGQKLENVPSGYKSSSGDTSKSYGVKFKYKKNKVDALSVLLYFDNRIIACPDEDYCVNSRVINNTERLLSNTMSIVKIETL